MSTPSSTESNLSLLSSAQWGELYPLSQLEQNKSSKNPLPLHFLIANCSSSETETVLAQIPKLKKKDIFYLSTADSARHGLTPLIIAAMRNLAPIAKAIFQSWTKEQKKIYVNSQDQHGFTALHHAAISSQEIYQFLLDNHANTQILTLGNGTVDDLQCLIGKKTRESYSLKNVRLMIHGSAVADVALKLKELMGLEYRDDSLYTQSSLIKLWNPSNHASDHFPKGLFVEKYKRMMKKPPRLTISTLGNTNDNSPFQFEVRAGQQLAFGAVLPPFAGEVLEENFELTLEEALADSESYAYVFSETDAQKKGNVTRFINCGWPNVMNYNLKYGGGYQRLFVVIAPQGIKENTPIICAYEPKHLSLNWGKHLLFGKDEMRKFYQKQSFDTLIESLEKSSIIYLKKLEKKTLTEEDLCQCEDEHIKYSFPLGNPAALLDLHFSGIVQANQWQEELTNPKTALTLIWMKTYPYVCMLVKSLLLRINELDQVLKNHEDVRKEVSEWVLNQVGQLTIMQILKGMQMIANDLILSESKIKNSSFSVYKTEMEDFLKDYKWTADENAPLSMQKRENDQKALMEGLSVDFKELDGFLKQAGNDFLQTLKVPTNQREMKNILKQIGSVSPNMQKLLDK